MRATLTVLVGVGLLVAGVVVLATGDGAGVDFGWFAYTPLDGGNGPDIFGDVVLLGTRRFLTGIVLGALGVAVLAGALGFWLGRRPGRT